MPLNCDTEIYLDKRAGIKCANTSELNLSLSRNRKFTYFSYIDAPRLVRGVQFWREISGSREQVAGRRNGENRYFATATNLYKS